MRPGAGRKRAGAAFSIIPIALVEVVFSGGFCIGLESFEGEGPGERANSRTRRMVFSGQSGSPAGRFAGRGRGEVRKASFVPGNSTDANVPKIQKGGDDLDCLHLQVVAKVPWGMGDFSSWGTFSRCDASSLSGAESWRIIGERCGARVFEPA